MKSIIASLAMLFVLITLPTQNSCAQQAKNYQFIYIDHEVNTPVNQLCAKLKELYEFADETGDALIIYLSTGLPSEEYRMLSLKNLKDVTGKDLDTEEAFNNIIGALQNANYHAVNPKADVNNIINLFDTYNYQDEKGALTYKTVKLNFYVGSRFWTYGYDYSVLSYLYSLLDVVNMPKGIFSFNVMISHSDKPKYPEEKPFGDANLQGINKNVNITLY